ncbi:nascent polypeptide-associated complex protein [Candidatus Micrarchaeota archaeon]|nr:nascent polypeptide-associated complex protein [Candidatus Micrarchaeota archaeon]
MIPGMNPKDMARVMKQMGIKNDELPAKRVVIELEDKKLIIEPAQVMQIEMQGQKTFQIMGNVKEESSSSLEDAKLVMAQASCSLEEAQNALKEANGDIAEAILKLQK